MLNAEGSIYRWCQIRTWCNYRLADGKFYQFCLSISQDRVVGDVDWSG